MNTTHNSAANKLLVRFYVYQQLVDEQTRLNFVCLLCEKAQAAKQRVAILCSDQTQAKALDERLWAFKPDSFIPHCFNDDDRDLLSHAVAVLSIVPQRLIQADIIINLSLENSVEIPRRCSRIFEIVNQTPEILKATRQRFLHYRQIGLTPQTHHLLPP